MKTLIGDHLVSLMVFAAITGVFFAFLYHNEKKALVRSFLKTFGTMVGVAIAFAWLMHLTS